MSRVRVVLAGLCLAVALAFGGPVRAQLEDPPVDELGPVLAPLAPSVGPACGVVGTLGLLGPAALTQAGLDQLAAPVLAALGPVFLVCGLIPPTAGTERWTCPADTQVLLLIGEVTGPLAGIGPVFDTRPVGQVLEQLEAVGALGGPGTVEPLTQEIAASAGCVQGDASALPPPAPPEPPPTGPPASPVEVVGDDDGRGVSFGPGGAPEPNRVITAEDLGAHDGAGGGTVAEPEAAPNLAGAWKGFKYPGIFLLPFMLALGAAAVGRHLQRTLIDDPFDPTTRSHP